MKVYQEVRNGQIVPVSMEIESEKEVEFLLDQLRTKGEWIKHINNLFPEESTEECPFCHEEQLLRLGNDDNFCPNCGADLRKGGKE